MKKSLLTLLIAAICLIANAQWVDDPMKNNLISPANAGIYDADLQVSKDGNTYVSFVRPMGGNQASILQIVDKDGKMLFPVEGLMVSHERTISYTMEGDILFVDRDGNAIIPVTDCRNSEPYPSQDISYTLYKVSPTGEMLWGAEGIELEGKEAFETVACMKIVQIEDGSYVCAWMKNIGNRSCIQLQRISEAGELLWNGEEVRLYNSSFDYTYPYLVNSGNNQVLLVFARGTGNVITARKIDFDGSCVWAEDVVIYAGGFNFFALQVFLNVIPDQMGGAFVGWYDDRYITFKESTFVSHVTTDGKLGFASGENGEQVGYNEFLRGFRPEMFFDKNEGFLYVVWRETSSGQSWQQLTGQKLKIPSGELMWDPVGVEISPLTEDHSIGFYSIQGDGKGNIALFYSSVTVFEPGQSYWGRDVNSAILFNSNGESVWENKIIQFSSIESSKSRLASTPLVNNNFWVTAWGDERKTDYDPSGHKKIYLQRVNIDGTLGDNGVFIKTYNPATESFVVFPTVVTGYAEFHINTENSCKADVSLYSIMGQKMETIYSGTLHNGENVISWNAQKNTLPKGIYIATLTLGAEKKSLRIIIN
jgi:hypothetical protein